MQYKTTCHNCGRNYMVDGQPGQTINAICPYCQTKATVVTPAVYEGRNAGAGQEIVKPAGETPMRRKREKPLFWKVTLWFLIVVTILFIAFTILYFVFTGISQ